jgi:hypothetical protein
MATIPYATPEQVQAVFDEIDPDGTATGTDAVTEAEVSAASHDIDDEALQQAPVANETLKLLPADLDPYQQVRLQRAVAHQIAYRRRMGPAFFVEAQYSEVSAADVSRKGTLPRLSPSAMTVLSGTGLIPNPIGTLSYGGGSSNTRVDSWDTGINPVYSVSQPLFPWLWRR